MIAAGKKPKKKPWMVSSKITWTRVCLMALKHPKKPKRLCIELPELLLSAFFSASRSFLEGIKLMKQAMFVGGFCVHGQQKKKVL